MKIRLAKPLDVGRTVIPVASFPSQQSDTYAIGHEPVSIHGATSFDVFVGFKERRVVWVIPMPVGSEGPPPTSIAPDTPPKGFVAGTNGASAQDAAQGLILRMVSFDHTGRLIGQMWFDPLTGSALTDVYNPERKLIIRYVSVVSAHAIRVTTIADNARTWASGQGPIGTATSGVTALDSRSLPAQVRQLTPDGTQEVAGVDAPLFTGTLGLFYWGLAFQGGSGEVWADPTTDLPIRQTLTNGRTGALEETTLFEWLPHNEVAAAASTAAVPAGYRHTPSTGLPHIFGD
ncbi:MAG TPA: hypothetical protein VGL76_01490 [Gaiellaceae bacterium]